MYERRKTGALEVERVARACASIPGDDDASSRALDALLDVLTREFAASARENHRKGGLIGLAAVIVGLGGLEDAAAGDLARDARRSPLALGLSRVVPAVLAAFGDPDARVRYYACEAMYNVVKVARTEILMGPGAGFLRAVFDALCVLAADSDANVQNASHLLDRLVKDVVSEGAELSRSGGFSRGGSRASSSGASSFDHPRRSFDAARALAPSIRAAIHATDPYVRQFLVGWISALDAAPDVDALPLLPDVLDGVLDMLADPNREIRQQADQALGEFLAEIRCARRRDEEAACAVSAGAVSSDRDAAAAEDRGGGTSSLAAADLGRLTETLARRTRSPDEFTRVVAVTWLREFVAFAAGAARGTAREAILPRVPEVASAVLPCLSHAEAKVRAVAAETSEALLLAALEGVREGAGGDDRDRDRDRDRGVGGADGAVEEDGTSEKKTSERTTRSRLSVRSLLDALASRLGESEGAATRREALRWFAALSDAAPRATRRLALGSAPRASEALLACLSHEFEEVAASAATALAALGRDARGGGRRRSFARRGLRDGGGETRARVRRRPRRAVRRGAREQPERGFNRERRRRGRGRGRSIARARSGVDDAPRRSASPPRRSGCPAAVRGARAGADAPRARETNRRRRVRRRRRRRGDRRGIVLRPGEASEPGPRVRRGRRERAQPHPPHRPRVRERA
jgi:vacuole morphology and inheritance protein 14